MAVQKQDTGAPANLKRLEREELEAFERIAAIREKIEALRKLEKPNDDSDAGKSLRQQIGTLSLELDAAYDLWIKLSKQLREFDKSVDTSRRDGVKIPQAEVEQMLTRVFRFDRVAFETHLLSISQDAIRCHDEQDFYEKFAASLRTCRETSIINGIEHSKFPAFVIECFKASL